MASGKSNEERQKNRARELKETDISNDRMGRNSLQGDDQTSVRNQRHAQPDTKRDPDEVMESFEKMDKDRRARTDLGKGNRSDR